MRKIISVVLMALIFTLLTACGSSGNVENTGKQELTEATKASA